MRTTPFTASIVFAALSVAASAQTVFPEIEPNGDKSEATSVVCLSAGDALTGSATGGVLTLGDTSSISGDTFRVRTCALPFGVYRHTLSLTSTTPGHTATLRGLVQAGTPGVGGAATAIDSTFSTATGTGTAPRVLAWIGRMLDPKDEGPFETWGMLAPTLEPLLRDEVAAIFFPWTAANAAALAEGRGEVSLEIGGKPFTQEPQKYHAKSLAVLRARYAAVADRGALDPVLAASGCLRFLAG